MSNEETKNVEDKQNNSLMRKTKAQLVEIILRKDNIERGLRADIKGTEAYCKELEAKVKHVCNANKELTEDDVKNEIDCITNRLAELIDIIIKNGWQNKQWAIDGADKLNELSVKY